MHTTSHTNPIVEIAALYKSYPGAQSPAVNGVDLRIPRGRIYGLLGPNGAGKTTLLSMLSGLLKPDAGLLRVAGLEVRHKLNEVKQLLGLVPQELALYPMLSARENLEFFGRLYGLRGSQLSQRVDACLAIAGLQEVAKRRAETYSGGLKRRLNLVIGLIHNPQLLVLDEPTVGIDPQSRNFIYETLRELNAGGMSIIYTTHYMEEVENLCDELAIIDHGRIIAQGPLQQLLGDHQYGNVEIRLQETPPAELVKALRGLNHIQAIQLEGRTLNLQTAQPLTGLLEALGILQRQQAQVVSLSLGAVHLEQVFLRLTGTRLRD